MGRGKKILLDDADNLLEELSEVKPVSRGYYVSVSAFISEHHDEFQAALQRGVMHEQIADLMQSYNITISPTTLRRYLPKKGRFKSETPVQAEEIVVISNLSIEQLACVAVAAMHVLELDEWENFLALCALAELEANYSLDDENYVNEVSFSREGQILSRQVDEVLVTFGDSDVMWAYDNDPGQK